MRRMKWLAAIGVSALGITGFGSSSALGTSLYDGICPSYKYHVPPTYKSQVLTLNLKTKAGKAVKAKTTVGAVLRNGNMSRWKTLTYRQKVWVANAWLGPQSYNECVAGYLGFLDEYSDPDILATLVNYRIVNGKVTTQVRTEPPYYVEIIKRWPPNTKIKKMLNEVYIDYFDTIHG